MPGEVGAPTKFTEETKEKILLAIRKGAPYEIACDYAGISYGCFKKWRNKAKDEQIPEFIAFFTRLKEAQGATALLWMDKIDKAMAEGIWQAAAWKLERRYYKYFSTNPVLLKEFGILSKKMDQIQKQLLGGNNRELLNDGEIKNSEGTEIAEAHLELEAE